MVDLLGRNEKLCRFEVMFGPLPQVSGSELTMPWPRAPWAGLGSVRKGVDHRERLNFRQAEKKGWGEDRRLERNSSQDEHRNHHGIFQTLKRQAHVTGPRHGSGPGRREVSSQDLCMIS